MSGYRGGIFKCPFYSRDYRDYLNCEGAQVKLPKEELDEYTRRYCANEEWRRCPTSGADAALRKDGEPMSERNRDKVKRLEHELGRYQKKVGELMKANAKLREDMKGLNQLRMAFDAWIIQIALSYGEAVKDPNTGEDIPRMKALHLERPKVNPLLGQYEIHQRVDEKNVMHIAVGLRDDPCDHNGAKEAEE